MTPPLIMRLARRVLHLVRRRPFDTAMDDEMRYHVECEAAERIRRGMRPDEAWRTAARDFGGIERHKEDARDVRGVRWIDDAVRDAGYAVRVLRHNPAFSAAVVLTFALGIACTSSIFSLVNGILLRPLPYADPARLVTLWERNEARKGGHNVVALTTLDAWRSRAQSFTSVAALAPSPLTLDGAPAERTKGLEVSPGYFRILGVHPAMGRDFDAADATNGSAPVTILSDGLWRTRFGADPGIVGRRISIDGRPVTVIGVMSAGFDPPRFGWIEDQPLWLPFLPTAEKRSYGRYLHVVARLRPGVSIDQARAEMLAISGHLAQEIPDYNGWSSSVSTLSETITGDVRAPLIVLFTAVALLLLMSTVNVASLVTTFMRSRSHELAVRRAIGATATRLVRQQLMQSALLGLVGTGVGLALAFAATRGALRAIRGSGAHSSIALVGTNRTTARLSGSRIIVAEVAIGLVLTVLATLMVRSLANLRSVKLGFDAASVVTGRVSLPDVRYRNDERRHAFFDELLTRARAIPGVTGASLVTSRPFACCAPATPVYDPSQPATIESAPITDVRYADDSYFATARIPVLAGEVFQRSEPRDGAVHVVISRTLARALWGDADPIGKTVSMALYNGTTARVIGLVGDVHLRDPHTPIRPSAYLSTERYPSSERDIVVRGAGDATALLAALRAVVASIDASIPLYQATSLDESVAETLAQDRFTTVLLGAFAAVSLVLAAIGVYGVLSGDVSRRRKEIGIRLALGAQAGGVTALVLRRALQPAVLGTAIGVIAALALARSMSALVFGIGTWDPLSFALVTVALLAVATIATCIPALRATRVSPIEAIRTD